VSSGQWLVASDQQDPKSQMLTTDH
jgi:hypothetical protein